MSLVEFFSLDLEQDSHTQVVYKADELIDISSGAVSMRLVGRRTEPGDRLPRRTYPPGSDTGEEMLNHEGEAGVLVDGRLELTVGSETYVLERGAATISRATSRTVSQSLRCAGTLDQRHHARKFLT